MSTKALLPKKRNRKPETRPSRLRTCQGCGARFSFWDHMVGAAGKGFCADCLPIGTTGVLTRDGDRVESDEPTD